MKFWTVVRLFVLLREPFQREGRGVPLADQVILVAAEPVGAVIGDVEPEHAIVRDSIRMACVSAWFGPAPNGKSSSSLIGPTVLFLTVISAVKFPATALGRGSG